MRYCKRCLNVSTRPNIKFDIEGLCYPCSVFVESFDFRKRAEKIIQVVKSKESRSHYDGILGVSGGKDSTRQAIFLKEKLGLNPLLVSLNYPPGQISNIGIRNLDNLVKLGFDCVNISLGPTTWADLMRFSFLNYGNWAKSTEHALFASVPKVALAKGIKIIWWGENPAILDGEMAVSGSEPWDGNRLKYNNTVSGGNVSWMNSAVKDYRKLKFYQYPTDGEISKGDIQIIFMDYLMQDFSYRTNSMVAAAHGFESRGPDLVNDGDFYGTSMLDEDFINVNMLLRYLKFGFGRASDIVNVEIRSGRLSREEGIRIVEKYDHVYDDKLIEEFSSFIGISVTEFWSVAKSFANPDLFTWDKHRFKRKFQIGIGT
jgi:N-acetyl sugar amidotransferase